MKTKSSRFLSIFVIIVILVTGKLAYQEFFQHKSEANFSDVLVRTSSQINSKLPRQVDESTRLDFTTSGPGSRLSYFYTLSGESFKGMNSDQVSSDLRPSVVNFYKTSPELALFRDNSVEIRVVYRDFAGKQLADIIVSANDLK